MLKLKGMRFPKEIILLCIRWYAAYPLRYRHLEEMLQARGVHVDHASVNRWAVKFLPLLEKLFRKHERPVGLSWRMAETYILVNSHWKYRYRAVDKEGVKTENQRRSRWISVAPTRRPWTPSTKTATFRWRCARSNTSTTSPGRIPGL